MQLSLRIPRLLCVLGANFLSRLSVAKNDEPISECGDDIDFALCLFFALFASSLCSCVYFL